MSSLKWWEHAVIYQIYPRSFQDSNSDGIGDLNGITSRLEYIADLGVDAIWISPIFMSPQYDYGYDVSNYYDINPEYGNLNDFDLLIETAHSLGLRLMIDIVAAHCSHLHPWFEESRKSKDNPKSDWFHWVDPKPDGCPPNNWLSFFGGSAWSWEPRRQQYYLHNFLSEQPNLNHANQEVQNELNKIARFWFDRGVDGFRLDAVHTINGDCESYKDNLPDPNFTLGPLPQDSQPFFRQLHDVAQLNQPVIQEFSKAYRKIADEYDGDRFLMGEVSGDDGKTMLVSQTFTEPGRLHATYNFDLLEHCGLTVSEMKEAISNALELFNGTGRLSFAFSNHDVPRSASRQLDPLGITSDKQDELQFLLLQLETSLIGSSCIYQGEELGLSDVTDIEFDKMKDPWGINFYPEFLGRDTCRTPMVWEKSKPMGGFTSANESWLPISKSHLEKAGLDMAKSEGSIYNKFSSFLKWRKHQPALMTANNMSNITGGPREIIFDRISETQTLRCKFDFELVKATFEEVTHGTG